MSKTFWASPITRGLHLCFLVFLFPVFAILIQQGQGKPVGSIIKEKDRTLVCTSCEPNIEGYPRCPDRLNPNQTILNTYDVDLCFQCFIEQTWVGGVYKGERRGCLAGDDIPPGSCTYHYPIDGDYYGLDDEVHEICRCATNNCNDLNITDLGGKGEISLFPKTTPISASSRVKGWGEYFKSPAQFCGLGMAIRIFYATYFSLFSLNVI